MKTIAAIATLLAAAALARADLLLQQKVDAAGQATEMTLKIKGDFARIDLPQGTSTLMNLANRETTILMHANKTTMSIPGATLDSAVAEARKALGQDKSAPAGKPVPTGKTAQIGGRATREFVSTIAGGTVAMWIATDYPRAQAILGELQKLSRVSSHAISPIDYATLPGIPLRTVMTLNGMTTTAEVLQINDAPLPASDFTLPADYTAMPMPTNAPAQR
jgi:hypothetical protein